jgi:hypothetical protein
MTDGGGGRGVGEAKRGQKAAQGGCGEVGMAQSGIPKQRGRGEHLKKAREDGRKMETDDWKSGR